MNAAIQDLATKLGFSEAQLRRLELKHVQKHGDQSDAKMERHLRVLWGKCRDRAHIPARQNGIVHPPQYVADPAGALPDEPESPDPDWLEERAAHGWVNFGVVKADEIAKREERSRAERVRQLERTLREKGHPAGEYARAIDEVVDTFKQKHKAA